MSGEVTAPAETPVWAAAILPYLTSSGTLRAPKIEARQAVEIQRKDQLDREERERAAVREHELAKLRLIQEAAKIDADERVALRNARGWRDEALISVAIGSPFLGALVAGLAAAAIP